MDLSHVQAIIFDAEGVVVDTEVLWDTSQEVLLERRGLAYDRDYLKPRMAGQTMLQGAQLMVDYYGLSEDPGMLADERKALIHDLFENDIHFIAGFQSFMQNLNGTSLKKSIATAMKKSLMKKVEAQLELEQYFGKHVYYIEDVGNKSKPEPDVFLHAAKMMDTDPENCIVIEDAPHGIEGANRAGMCSIGIVTTFNREQLKNADFVAENFDQLLSFLRESEVSI